MRKIIIAIAALALIASATASADEYVKGGFEASGTVNAGVGYQHWSANTPAAGAPVTTGANGGATSTFGALGSLNVGGTPVAGTAATAFAKADEWAFFLQSVELDLMKDFGDMVTTRVDLDFGAANASSINGLNGVAVEQAYVTTGLGSGEFLVGQFNAPIGLESVDVADNDLFSTTAIFRALRPQNVLGAKFYYAWGDIYDWHLYVVNNLRNSTNANGGLQNLPGIGTRFGLTFGDDAQPSTFGISVAAGEEANTAGSKRGEWSYLGDVDWSWWATDAFNLAGEVIFRLDNSKNGTSDDVNYGGQLNFTFVPSDVWDGTFRYAYTHEKSAKGASSLGSLFGSGATAGLQAHEVSLGGQYYITDGAKVQIESRFDLVKPDSSVASAGGTGKTYYTYGGAVNFAYDF